MLPHIEEAQRKPLRHWLYDRETRLFSMAEGRFNRVKRCFLDEWVNAVNNHGGFGRWSWDVASEPGEIRDILARHAEKTA